MKVSEEIDAMENDGFRAFPLPGGPENNRDGHGDPDPHGIRRPVRHIRRIS
jgi:hypothetical protein